MKLAVAEMVAALDEWRDAGAGLAEAVRRRDRAVARAERKLAAALGGPSLARWRDLVAGRASLRDPAVGRAVFDARRNRLRVEVALAELHETQVVGAADVAAAKADLERAARRCAPLVAGLRGQ